MKHTIKDTHVSATVSWRITFDEEPTPDVVADIIQDRFPAAGYGESVASLPTLLEGRWVVFVRSNASCD